MRDRLRNRLHHLYSTQGFRGPVLTLLSGSTIVLVIAYLSQPILTRLYTPDAFGISDYFVAVMTVLISFTSLRYEDALMLPEDDQEAAGVAWLALVVLLGFVLLLSGMLFWRDGLATLMGLPGIAPWLLLVPPTLLAMRAAKIAELWLIRAKRFRPVTAGQVTGTSTMVAARIGAALPPLQAGAGGLINGFLVGHIAGLLVLGGSALRRNGRLFLAAFGIGRIASAARRYRRFPLFSTPSSLLSALVARLPFFLIPLYFQDEALLGFFGRAFNVLAIPLSLVGGAIASVFFVHAAEAHRDERLTEVTVMVHRRLVMLGFFPTAALTMAGPDVFEVVFGAPWREAGVFMQYLGPWLFMASVASPLTRLFDVLERQRLDLATSALMFITMTGALILGGRTGDVKTMLLLLSSVGVGVRLVHLVVLLRLADVAGTTALRAYGRYALFSLPGLLLIAGALQVGPAWVTTVAAALAGLLYAGLVLWKDQLLAARSNP